MPYRPGYIEGKRKKAFYLDEGLARELAHISVDTGASQSEIVERALRRELEQLKSSKPLQRSGLTVVSRAEAESDWSFGYLDGMPAVGDWMSNWYIVGPDTAVRNLYEGTVWYLSSGQWHRVDRRKWNRPITPKEKITETDSDFIEE